MSFEDDLKERLQDAARAAPTAPGTLDGVVARGHSRRLMTRAVATGGLVLLAAVGLVVGMVLRSPTTSAPLIDQPTDVEQPEDVAPETPETDAEEPEDVASVTPEETDGPSRGASGACTRESVGQDLGYQESEVLSDPVCVADWGWIDRCPSAVTAEPDGFCPDAGVIIHVVDGRWTEAGALLQDCAESFMDVGATREVAVQFYPPCEGYPYDQAEGSCDGFAATLDEALEADLLGNGYMDVVGLRNDSEGDRILAACVWGSTYEHAGPSDMDASIGGVIDLSNDGRSEILVGGTTVSARADELYLFTDPGELVRVVSSEDGRPLLLWQGHGGEESRYRWGCEPEQGVVWTQTLSRSTTGEPWEFVEKTHRVDGGTAEVASTITDTRETDEEFEVSSTPECPIS